MYSLYMYNSPEKGNKHIYAYGEQYESINFCGFIRADNIYQARKCLEALNRAWLSDNILLDYNELECKQEMKRRKSLYGIT